MRDLGDGGVILTKREFEYLCGLIISEFGGTEQELIDSLPTEGEPYSPPSALAE